MWHIIDNQIMSMTKEKLLQQEHGQKDKWAIHKKK